MQIRPKGRVLFLEGPQLGSSASGSLARAGFEVRRASQEAEALELADKEYFDVLVVDLELPRMDGSSLVRRMRERSSAAAVVWITSHYTNELAALAAEAGVLQLLQKPIDAKVLERVVSLAAVRTHHILTLLRTIVRPTTVLRSVAATDAKNEFGAILDTAVQDGAVVITKHDTPKAVLVSVDRADAMLSKHEPDLQALSREFDDLVARMQTPKARAAARGLLSATPQELGDAALAGVNKRHG
jgi:prevent-host-death family protein